MRGGANFAMLISRLRGAPLIVNYELLMAGLIDGADRRED